MPTQDPFVYTISVTATEGVPLARVEDVTLAAIEDVRTQGLTPQELRKAKNQLRARLVFENDSITNMRISSGTTRRSTAGASLRRCLNASRRSRSTRLRPWRSDG
jgi:hypothetical protein